MSDRAVTVRIDHPHEPGSVAIWDQHEAEAIERIRGARAYYLVTIPAGRDTVQPLAASHETTHLEMLRMLASASDAATTMGAELIVEVLRDVPQGDG